MSPTAPHPHRTPTPSPTSRLAHFGATNNGHAKPDYAGASPETPPRRWKRAARAEHARSVDVQWSRLDGGRWERKATPCGMQTHKHVDRKCSSGLVIVVGGRWSSSRPIVDLEPTSARISHCQEFGTEKLPPWNYSWCFLFSIQLDACFEVAAGCMPHTSSARHRGRADCHQSAAA